MFCVRLEFDCYKKRAACHFRSFASGEPGAPARPPNCWTGETPVPPPNISSAGREWSTDVPAPAESSYTLAAASEDLLASRADVEAAMADAGLVLLDVRAELEYEGERFWPSGATADVGRAGHVPGAISVPIGLLRNQDDTPKPVEEVRGVLERAGVAPDKKVITYCTRSE